MKRLRVAPKYSKQYLEIDRPQPLSDQKIESLIQEVLSGKIDNDITDHVYDNFKDEMLEWILNTKNLIKGLHTFKRIDIMNGCTQFIDNIYMKGPVQTLIGDYTYHTRLNPDIIYSTPEYIRRDLPLILAMPFPNIGDIQENIVEILDDAHKKNVKVHIDGAWFSCSQGIVFDVSHPAIESVGISLSKGLGLGWNRIGLRLTKNAKADSITIMNDFNMNLRAPVMIGLHFLRNLPSGYLWNTYEESYYKICKDFDLTPTKSIHIALQNGNPVGVSPLIRNLHETV
jgi:hypothetical protein